MQKKALGMGVTVTYAHSVGFIYFVIRVVYIKSPFRDIFDAFLFLYVSSFSLKSVSSSHYRTNTQHVRVLNSPNQISSKWILSREQD